MLYLNNIQESQELLVPRNEAVSVNELIFKAKSTIDLDWKIEQEVTDSGASSLYYTVSISLPEGLPDGQYEYSLEGDGQVLSSGVLIIGQYDSPSSDQYQKEITYEQYVAE